MSCLSLEWWWWTFPDLFKSIPTKLWIGYTDAETEGKLLGLDEKEAARLPKWYFLRNSTKNSFFPAVMHPSLLLTTTMTMTVWHFSLETIRLTGWMDVLLITATYVKWKKTVVQCCTLRQSKLFKKVHIREVISTCSGCSCSWLLFFLRQYLPSYVSVSSSVFYMKSMGFFSVL